MIKRVLTIQIDEAAFEIERMYGSYMIPYKEGIYVVGGELPVMEKGKYYYHVLRKERNKLREIPLRNMNIKDFNLPIYNEDGIMVINERMIANKVKCLAYRPTVPINGRKICKEFIESTINKIVEYSKLRNYQTLHGLIKKILQDNYLSFDDIRDNVSELSISFITQVRDFVYYDPRQIYSVTRFGGVITITELGDYRIEEATYNNWVEADDRSSIE